MASGARRFRGCSPAEDHTAFVALCELDVRCAKHLANRRNVECSGEDYENFSDIAKELDVANVRALSPLQRRKSERPPRFVNATQHARLKPQEFIKSLEACTSYPLSDWSTQLGITRDAPASGATTSTPDAAGVSDLPATAAQQHSLAFQLKAMGFTIGSCCAIKEEFDPAGPPAPKGKAAPKPKASSEKPQLRVWEIASIDDDRVLMRDPNRETNGVEDTASVKTEDAVLNKALLKRQTFKKQVQISQIGVYSTAAWDEKIALDTARRALKKLHNQHVLPNDQLQLLKYPSAVRAQANIAKGELTLVPSSNRFELNPSKTSTGVISLGQILGYEVAIRPHIQQQEEDQEKKDMWMAPYWHVPEAIQDGGANMKMKDFPVEVVTDSGPITIMIRCMQNTKKINKGDYLTVPPQKRKRS